MVLKKKTKKKVVTVKKKALKNKTPKKIATKKPAKKSVSKKKPAVIKVKKAKERVIGTITHYFPHVQAAVIKLKAPLAAGQTIKIKGHTTDFIQAITSMQIDRVPINSAKAGQEIGLLVNSRVRQGDLVYKA